LTLSRSSLEELLYISLYLSRSGLYMEIKNERHFDMRAPPRRRVPKEKDSSETENQPIFLRKAYAMISNCPNDIGTNY